MKYADLHLHTIFSDGTYTPKQLIQEACRVGLSAIAIADHDNVDAIEPALKEYRGKKIEVIPAIELSAEHEDSEIHILGYLIDYKNKHLKERLAFLRRNRIERVYKMVDKLVSMGINLKPEAVFALAENATVGRLHIARAMVNEGFIKSTAEAFYKYIGDKSPAYVCGFKLSPLNAINLIKSSGGIAVLAHPYLIKDEKLIPSLVRHGLRGLEIYYPEHSKAAIKHFLKLAKKFDLLATGGSDCHGKAKPEAKIGSIKIPYELVEKLKKAQDR